MRAANFLIRLVFCVTAIFAGALLGWGGQRWHQTPSLQYVSHLPVPWWAWGAAIIAYGLVLLFGAERTRVGAWLAGFMICFYFSISICWSIPAHPAVNPWVCAVMVDVAAVHVWFAFHAGHERRGPDRLPG